jgi:hypothetical protein
MTVRHPRKWAAQVVKTLGKAKDVTINRYKTTQANVGLVKESIEKRRTGLRWMNQFNNLN